jgi:hypothetical protein
MGWLLPKNPLTLFWMVLAAFSGGVGLGVTLGASWESDRTEACSVAYAKYVVTAEMNAARAEAEKARVEAQWSKEIEDAKAQSQARETEIQRDLDASAAAVGRLRNEAGALRTRLAHASRSAAADTAALAGELLAACADQYRDVAGKAERHASDVKTLIASWPQ